MEALEELRFPYWDWASPSTLAHGVPAFFFKETVKVAVALEQGKKFPESKRMLDIANPLKAYTLPRKLGTMSLVGDQGKTILKNIINNLIHLIKLMLKYFRKSYPKAIRSKT